MRKKQFSRLTILVLVFFAVFAERITAQEKSTVEIVFEGNTILSTKELFNELNKCPINIQASENEQSLKSAINYCFRKTVLESLWSLGYLKAVFSDTDEIAITKFRGITKAVVKIDEGKRYRIGDVQTLDLKPLFKEKFESMFSLKKGGIANGLVIRDLIFNKLRKTFDEKGFSQADFYIEPEFLERIDETEGIVNYKISVDEGKKYRIGEITFTGDNIISEKFLLGILNLREGQVYREIDIIIALKKLNELKMFDEIEYENKGGSSTWRNIFFTTNEDDKLIHIEFTLIAR